MTKPPDSGFSTRWITLGAALAVIAGGVVTTLSSQFTFPCTLEVRIDEAKGDPATLRTYRRELLEHLWAPQGSPDPGLGANSQWTVWTRPDRGTLQYTFLAPSREDGREILRQLGDSYIEHLRRVASDALNTPSDAEVLLARRTDVLEARLKGLRAVQAASGDIERDNPQQQRDAALASLDARRLDYDDVRRQLDELSAELEKLRATPVPRSIRIDPDVRRQALESDVELTQDLASLRVNLAEVRARLLEAHSAATPAVESLLTASAALCALTETEAAKAATGRFRLIAERLVEAGETYRDGLTTFVAEWNEAARKVRDTKPDPPEAATIEQHKHMSRLLGDLLFATVEPLSRIKEEVDALNAETHEAARHHELISSATRRFHKLRTAHHRFEFIASDVKALNNPRLDGALQFASKLRRRAEQRTKLIQRRLRDEAYQEAVTRRRRTIEALEAQVADLRKLSDRRVDSMLGAQDQLRDAAPEVDEWLRQKFTAEERAKRLEELQEELETTRTRLSVLATSRTAPVTPNAVTVVDRHVGSTPANLRERIAAGWAVTATGLVFVLLAHTLFFASRRG